MIVYISLFVLTVILPLCRIGPPIVRGGRLARNNPIRVRLPSDDVTIAQNNYPPGRAGQEIADWVHRWIGALLLTAWVPFVVPSGFVGEFLTFLAVAIALAWSAVFNRHFELVGHGVEIMIAERNPQDVARLLGGGVVYRTAEINRMLRSDSTFRGETFHGVKRGIEARTWISRILLIWAERN